jgi:hypothetical protein
VAGLEMRLSRSSPFGTRRSRPTHPGESPKHTGWPRRAQQAVQFALSAGCQPLGGDHLTSGLSTPTTRAPSVSGVIGRLLAPRRAPPNVRARTSGRWPSMSAGRHPLGAHCDNESPEHGYHAHAERVGRDLAALSTT